MAAKTSPRELFIVDNDLSGWTGLRYLKEWCGLARQLDVATGYFDIGALLDLKGKWQKLEKIRILMGAPTSGDANRSLRFQTVQNTACRRLDESIERSKESKPLLHHVPEIVNALRSKQIECRIYDREKFHAKAYITHAAQEIVGDRALVGSSNFTRPGLTKNIELNVQIQSGWDVAALREWFDAHWNQAREVTDEVIKTISWHTRDYSPFEVYGKALHELFRGREPSASEWEEKTSHMFWRLDRYQKEAYWSLMKIARQHGGAFLCDGVGLGKTFVGLMLIERFVVHERQRVVLFAPKAAREGVWDPHLRRLLPNIESVGFTNLFVFNHTDIGRGKPFPETFQSVAKNADVVLIDEAHHFRNPGRRGDPKRGISPSRYRLLLDLLDREKNPKTVFLLTATPINNSLRDFQHMTELFSRQDDYFADTIGVRSLPSHFLQMEKALRSRAGQEESNTDAAEHLTEAQEILATDKIFRELVVQRSRAYARKSQEREHGRAADFPRRELPQVAAYSIRKTYGRMLDLFNTAFAGDRPLFMLPMYYPLHWYKGADKDIDPLEENRQKQVVGLIRVNFLKRFESSIASFELSCARLLRKLLAFVKAHSESDVEEGRLERWSAQHAEVLRYVDQRTRELWGDDAEEDDDEDIVPQEMLDAVERLDRSKYKVEEMISEAFLDLSQMAQFLDEVRKFEPIHDDKLQTLIKLLQSEPLAQRKLLIFTEFAHTARYLKRHLNEAGISDVEQVDSATKGNRADVVKRFSPYYNGLSSPQLREQGHKEIRVLISTDVLSEGLNLQDASSMINYDIHWNPVRLMQRIGRVDRRMDRKVEARLRADHSEVASSRGKVWFWNFLPPEELKEILSLYGKVTQKTLLISQTFGIEGKKLFTPEDDYEALKDFNHAYEGTRTVMEDIHLEYQSLLEADPELKARLEGFPRTVFSGRERPTKGARGVFFCYALPAFDKEKREFSLEAGATRWYLYDLDSEKILEEPGEIIASIRSKRETPRRCTLEEGTLLDIRRMTEAHIKNSYLKSVEAPMGVRPQLRCWMELNEG